VREKSLGLASGYIVGAYREVKAAFIFTPALPCCIHPDLHLLRHHIRPVPPTQSDCDGKGSLRSHKFSQSP
jgi:hypothetical protein